MKFDLKGFGCNVFSEKEMAKSLPGPVFDKWHEAYNKEDVLDANTASAIAHAMKEWAISKGCTHFTHWFHPLSGVSAEKHEAFFDNKGGMPITKFSGKALIKGEPDASSFPNGGLRSTFEARGYSYWDCRSSAFIRDNILYIPSIFVSFNGESLDTKKPLLESLEVLSKEATRVCNSFGMKDVKEVKASIGLEQEYFLVDKELFLKRRDLFLTGRTLLGALPPKGQELEQHYLGSIPSRVKAFMDAIDEELWKLGIYAKSEHNEVAPGQFELAPIYTTTNLAIDQNIIMMDVMQKEALKQGLVCLLAEKPYNKVNGSGKHNNYSLVTDTGVQLFDPGKDASDNVRFLLFVCAFIKAVDEYPELIRLASSGPGNDFRLGANEAPPAIVSIFLSKPVEDLLNNLISGKPASYVKSGLTDFGLLSISELPKDSSDRNRTSPIAFTGNKFEFRMLGSSLNPSELNTVINASLAKSLRDIADILESHKYRQDVRKAALEICSDIFKKHKRVIFDGDGYSEDWIKEASKRGLPNLKTFVEAVPHMTSEKSIDLFTSLKVYSKEEIEARAYIKYRHYINIRSIEVKTMISMIYSEFLPALTRELKDVTGIKEEFMPRHFIAKAKRLSDEIDIISDKIDNLKDIVEKVLSIENVKDKAIEFVKTVMPVVEDLRNEVDMCEKYISFVNLPYPNYEKLLFDIDYK